MSRDKETKTKTPLHFTLQEVVQRSGLSEHTLRYYEPIGWINGQRIEVSGGMKL